MLCELELEMHRLTPGAPGTLAGAEPPVARVRLTRRVVRVALASVGVVLPLVLSLLPR